VIAPRSRPFTPVDPLPLVDDAFDVEVAHHDGARPMAHQIRFWSRSCRVIWSRSVLVRDVRDGRETVNDHVVDAITFRRPTRGGRFNARVQRVVMPDSEVESWTLLGEDRVPVEPVERFLAFLTAIERSPNTI
jgi:hypothetical protein